MHLRQGFFSRIFSGLIFVFGLTATIHAQEFPPDNAPFSSWNFDYGIWVSDYGYPPVAYTNLVSVESGAKEAVLLDTNVAYLQYNVWEGDGFTNLTVDSGTVAVWVAPNWASTNLGGTGPGTWGRLIDVGSYTTNADGGWWSLYVDPEGANIYFSAQTNGFATNYLYYPISWNSNEWHHVALTYSATNSALYIDAVLATNGPPVSVFPGPDVLTNGFYLGSDNNGVQQARAMFDGLSTFAIPLDESAIRDMTVLYSVVYEAPAFFSGDAPSAPATVPTFRAVAGQGNLQLVSSGSGCGTSPNVWITNVVCTPITNGVNVTFTIAGGSNGVAYDVFAIAPLALPNATNQWVWMGQGYQCNTYMMTNLPSSQLFLVLGTALDTDQDGLTDAYERLVSKTDPNSPDSSGDGMLDGWKVLWGLNTGVNNPGVPSQRSNYTYDPVGWLKVISGMRTGSVDLDFEGNVTQSSQ